MRKLASLFAFLLLCCAASHSQTSAPPADFPPFTLKPLGNNVYAAIDGPKHGAGSNAGFIIGDDGVAVIDTFVNAAAATQLLTEIQKLTKLPVRFVINTHYHLDHVAGNQVFRNAGAVIIAQQNVASWIRTENLKFFGKNPKPEQTALVKNLVGPDVLYDQQLALRLGSRTVLLGMAPGHTGGDTMVMIPDAHMYFLGDLFWRHTLPNLIDATTSAWANTLISVSALSKSSSAQSTIYVPGHGDVGNAADVSDFLDYLTDLRKMVQEGMADGKTGDDLVFAVQPRLREKYGSLDLFDYFSKRNILDVAAEFSGTKRVPSPTTAGLN